MGSNPTRASNSFKRSYGKTKLGDVMLTRAAKFRLGDEFRKAPYNGKTYVCTSLAKIPDGFFSSARPLLDTHKDKLSDAGPVTRTPRLWADGHRTGGNLDFPKFRPILTADYFEYGTSTNHLEKEGCGVEMGDAVLGMVLDDLQNKPDWLVVRNASDPRIDGTLSKKDQVADAVNAYKKYGYWTSVNSAVAVWAVIAAL